MKHYTSIIEAIKYRTHCPACKKQLQVNETELAEEKYGQLGQKIYVFYVDQRYQSTCEIDSYTSKVVININDNVGLQHPYYHSRNYSLPNYTVQKGKFMHALHVECAKCHHYGFTLQVHIDLTTCLLEGVFLNSEALVFDNDKLSCEIRNNYAFDKTEFTYWKRGGLKKLSDSKKMIIPLMKVDFEKPLDSFDRLKKLAIYY